MSRLTIWGYDIEWPDIGGAGRRLVGHFVKPAGATVEHPLGPPPVTETPMSKDPHRVELRRDFPYTMSFWKPDETVDRLRKMMQAEGVQEYQGARINIAYPHKNPDVFPGHFDGALQSAVELRKVGREYAPGVEWRIATEIVENVALGRSEDQSSIHALTARQQYVVRPVADDVGPQLPFRFKNPDTGKPELFVIVDDCIEQGTTLANLLSYIEKNGGKVVAAIAAGHMDLPQNRVERNGHFYFDNKGSPFFDPTRNTGRLPQLAHSFSKAAKRDGLKISPQKCMDVFEGRLNLFGNSVFAMTDGECERLAETMNRGHYGQQMSFKALIKKLDDKLEAYAKQEASQAIVDAAAANPAAASAIANSGVEDNHARKVRVRLPPAMY